MGWWILTADALEVSPLVHQLSTLGQGSHGRITVKNTSDSAFPLDIEIVRITFSDDGSYQVQPAEDDLMVFPPAVMLAPGGRQALRIQWVGDADLARSQSYFVRLAQPPLHYPGLVSNSVRLMMTFNVLVHVAGPDNSAKLVVESTDLASDEEAGLIARIANRGNRYAYMSEFGIVIKDASGNVSRIAPGALREQAEDEFLAPGSVKLIHLSLPENGATWQMPLSLELFPASL